MCARLADTLPLAEVALHFHDTRGTAIANVIAAIEGGVRIFDAASGGLGGCPYAPGASGNLATEDLVYVLERMGVATGIDQERLCQASTFMQAEIGRPLPGRMIQAYSAGCRTPESAS